MPFWINYRQELHGLIHGDARTVGQGYWIVVRMMRLGDYSVYWNEAYQEAIDGPKWNYDDYLIKCISKPGGSVREGAGAARQGSSPVAEIGLDDTSSMIFAIEAPEVNGLPRLPTSHDLVYEITQAASRVKPVPPLVVTDRYRIRKPFPIRGDHGRVEVIYLGCERVHGES